MYSKLVIKALSLFLLISILTSCGDESIMLAPKDYGYDYYPVEVGNYWIYKMDSIVIMNGGGIKVVTTSYIKEEITDLFNSAGDTTHVLTISKAKDLNGSFNATDRYKINKTGSRLVRTEENLGFIKLFFPVEAGDELDANLFDHLLVMNIGQQEIDPYKEWRFKVLSNNIDRTFNNVAYENLAQVQLADHENDVEIRKATEYYARGVGLVRKEHIIFDDQCGTACVGQDWTERAMAGYSLVQTLVEHN